MPLHFACQQSRHLLSHCCTSAPRVTGMRFSTLAYFLSIGTLCPRLCSTEHDGLIRNPRDEHVKNDRNVDSTGISRFADDCPATSLPFNFGSLVGDSLTSPNDDGSSDPLALTLPVRFLGQEYNVVYQNTNGHISFQQPQTSFYWQFLPTSEVGALAAAYWTDINTLPGGDCQNDMWLRYSQLPDDTEIATAIVSQATGSQDFAANAVIVATWYNVNSLLFQNESATFQLAMVWDETAGSTWAILAYDHLEYALAASGFNDGMGLRGGLASVINNDTDAQALLDGSNMGVPGLYSYQVNDDFESVILPPTLVPTIAPTVCLAPPANLPFPFGFGAGDLFTGPNDDGSSPPVLLGTPLRFLGDEYSIAFQNTNGDVSFGNSSFRYYWEYLPSDTVEPMAAIFWTDLYTGADGICSNQMFVRYSESSSDLAIASTLLSEVRSGGTKGHHPSSGSKSTDTHHSGSGSSKGGWSSFLSSFSVSAGKSLKGKQKAHHEKLTKGSKLDHYLMSMASPKGTSSSKGKGSSSKDGGSTSASAPFDAVLVATWYRVESFGDAYGPGATDTFQLAMAWNDEETWAIYSYGQLDFFGSSPHGSAIGFNGRGGSEGGLVGVSDSPEDADILMTGSNIGHAGVFAFEVSESLLASEGEILDVPEETSIPTSGPYIDLTENDGKK
ncbi:hypothetical protein MPSEU_000290400 [Mayamaea pseudoterrestris]|nr:hypothetical protein MPSEU_000290400 [Mayamaea pseudoterrestris]